MFYHCRHCLCKDEPSGYMEVGRAGDEIVVRCNNCKKEVVRTPLPDKFKILSCACCDKDEH